MDERSFGAFLQEEFESSVLRHYNTTTTTTTNTNDDDNIAGQKDSVVVQESEALLLECMWDDFFASNDTPASEIHMISKSSDSIYNMICGSIAPPTRRRMLQFSVEDERLEEVEKYSEEDEDFQQLPICFTIADQSLSSLDNVDGIEEPLWIGKCLAPTTSTHHTNQLSSTSLSTTTSTIEAPSPSSSSSSLGTTEDNPTLRSDHPSSREHDTEMGGCKGRQSYVISSPTGASCLPISVCSSQKTSSSTSMSDVSIPIEPYNGTYALPSTKGSDYEHTNINRRDITKTTNIQPKFIPVTSTTSSVAYPFTVLKPSGVQGDITLDDINQRISTKTTSIINMPNASHSTLPHGSEVSKEPMLSPKENQTHTKRPHKKIKRYHSPIILGCTKIHTEGKGSITIIRTKN